MSEFVLYNYFRSSASYRVRIAMNLKSLPFEYRAVHLVNEGGEQFREEYKKVNPSREVPTLVHNGRVIAQSVAIIDYLDNVRPQPRLFPQEAYLRAQVLQACEIINSGVQPMINLRVLGQLEKQLGASQEQKNLWAAHWITYGLETLETFIKPHAKDYCFGFQVSAADCFLIPHLFGADRFNVSLEPYPTLARIRQNCEALEPFKKAAPAAQPDTPPAT